MLQFKEFGIRAIAHFEYDIAELFSSRIRASHIRRQGEGKRARQAAAAASRPSPRAHTYHSAQWISRQRYDMRYIDSAICIIGRCLAGKTTFLQHALRENKTERYGLLVNDMASVNIDAKLIKRSSFESPLIDTLELQNGCVCCSLADDMMVTIRQFVLMAEENGIRYDHILLECSGIAEPRRVRDIFREYMSNPSSGLSSVRLDTFVTVIDANVFHELFGSDATVADHRNLAVGKSMDWDSEEDAVGESANSDYLDEASSNRCITELLLEQVECADIVMINKSDLLQNKDEDIKRIRSVIQGINPMAAVYVSEYGVVSYPAPIIGAAGGRGMAALDIIQEHRMSTLASESDSHTMEHSHVHSHSHSDSDGDLGECIHHGPGCGHDHSHEHEHHDSLDSEETTALKRFGISSFVYRRRRPFHPVRFYQLLKRLGNLSIRGLPDVKPLDTNAVTEIDKLLLRSKGFVWLGSSSRFGYYLSHSGQFLELNILGDWWDSLPATHWPDEPAAIEEIKLDFEGEHGDRRQELIFIGQFKSPAAKEIMEKTLDECLLTDDEMRLYSEAASRETAEDDLRHIFIVDDDA